MGAVCETLVDRYSSSHAPVPFVRTTTTFAGPGGAGRLVLAATPNSAAEARSDAGTLTAMRAYWKGRMARNPGDIRVREACIVQWRAGVSVARVWVDGRATCHLRG